MSMISGHIHTSSTSGSRSWTSSAPASHTASPAHPVSITFNTPISCNILAVVLHDVKPVNVKKQDQIMSKHRIAPSDLRRSWLLWIIRSSEKIEINVKKPARPWVSCETLPFRFLLCDLLLHFGLSLFLPRLLLFVLSANHCRCFFIKAWHGVLFCSRFGPYARQGGSIESDWVSVLQAKVYSSPQWPFMSETRPVAFSVWVFNPVLFALLFFSWPCWHLPWSQRELLLPFRTILMTVVFTGWSRTP